MRASETPAAVRIFFFEILRTAGAALAMGAAVFGALKGCDHLLESWGFGSLVLWVRVLRALGGVAVGVASYALFAWVLRLCHLRQAVDLLVRRNHVRAAADLRSSKSLWASSILPSVSSAWSSSS